MLGLCSWGPAINVELLYFEGLPRLRGLLPRLRELVGDRADVELHRVETAEEAERVAFLGSPTLRVDGTDVDPNAAGRTGYGMKCRLYPSGDGHSHKPPDDWIRQALKGAR